MLMQVLSNSGRLAVAPFPPGFFDNMSIGDKNKQHYKAYQNVINHPLWDKSTNEYKAFNLENYFNYYHAETGKSIEGDMLKLYNQFCEYYKQKL